MKRGAIPEGPEKPMAQAMDGEGEGWGRGRAEMGDVVRTFSLTPASERNLSSLSSRRVRKQNMEWSKGAIFLIATLRPDGRWMAEQTCS